MKTLICALALSCLLSACSIWQEAILPLPDLVVAQARVSLMPPLCLGTHSRDGALVYIENRGSAASGAFVVNLNGAEQSIDNLAAGAGVELWFGRTATLWTEIRVVVDSLDQVTESDESNNERVAMLVTLTPPMPCTPTPAAS